MFVVMYVYLFAHVAFGAWVELIKSLKNLKSRTIFSVVLGSCLVCIDVTEFSTIYLLLAKFSNSKDGF